MMKISPTACVFLLMICFIEYADWIPKANAGVLRSSHITCSSDYDCPEGAFCDSRYWYGPEMACKNCVNCSLYSKKPGPTACTHKSWECGPCEEGFEEVADLDKRCRRKIPQLAQLADSHKTTRNEPSSTLEWVDSPVDNQTQELPKKWSYIIIVVAVMGVVLMYGVYFFIIIPDKAKKCRRRRTLSDVKEDGTELSMLASVSSEGDKETKCTSNGQIVPSAPHPAEYERQTPYNNDLSLHSDAFQQGNPLFLHTKPLQACPFQPGNGAGQWIYGGDAVDRQAPEPDQAQVDVPDADEPEDANIVPQNVPEVQAVPEAQEEEMNVVNEGSDNDNRNADGDQVQMKPVAAVRNHEVLNIAEQPEEDVVMEELPDIIDIDEVFEAPAGGDGQVDNPIPENPLEGLLNNNENNLELPEENPIDVRSVVIHFIYSPMEQLPRSSRRSFDPQETSLDLSVLNDSDMPLESNRDDENRPEIVLSPNAINNGGAVFDFLNLRRIQEPAPVEPVSVPEISDDEMDVADQFYDIEDVRLAEEQVSLADLEDIDILEVHVV